MSTTERARPTATDARVALAIQGMTCASCAARIEKRLNRLDGVSATVNYATEKADVAHGPQVDPAALVSAVEAAGYGATLIRPRSAAAGDPAGPVLAVSDPLRRRLLVSLALTVPVVVLAMVPPLQFTYWQWASLSLAAPVVVWGAWPFHRAAWTNLRHGTATMDTLVSLGTSAAFGWSLYALFLGTAGVPGMRHGFELTASRGDAAANIYLEVAAGVTTFILAGRYAEARSKRRAGSALRALLELGAKEVSLLGASGEQRVPAETLIVGDRFVVRPGERVATDGVVEDGVSAVDASMLTGESVPVEVGPGAELAGATVNQGGRIVVRATRVGADTQLAQIARLVEQAQTGKAAVQRLADRVSAVFVPVVIGLAVVTLIGWLVTGHSAVEAIAAAVATVIIACPCALGLATPTALLVGTGLGATRGIVIRGPQVIERTGSVDTVVFDKTGTLTTGSMTLARVTSAAGESEHEVLAVAAAVESLSEHPIARAVVAGAAAATSSALDGVARRSGDAPQADEPARDLADAFVSASGSGVRATVGDRDVVVGRVDWLASEHGIDLAGELAEAIEAEESLGRTAVVVAWNGRARGVLSVEDRVRPSAVVTLERLRARGLEAIIVTGDNAGAAARVASQLGVVRVVAGVLPGGKLDVVRELQGQGRVVAVVGDGVNDSAALAGADVGIALAGGSDAALEAGDITLVRDDLTLVPEALELSKRTLRTIRQNLFWAFAYNVAALPIAMLGLLNPVVAGLAMALSSLIVMGNSLLLRRRGSL
jgi:Cu+-exporting ATPase